jgi:hypothetical protein
MKTCPKRNLWLMVNPKIGIDMNIKNIIQALLAIVVVVFLVNIIPAGCTRPDKTIQILEQQGYKDIKITGWRPFMAGKDESISTGFEATAPNGQRVTGAVTSGVLFKGSTIRFD